MERLAKILLIMFICLPSLAHAQSNAAILNIEDASKKADAESQLHLGNLYLKGEGLACDYKKAYQWFLKSC